MTNRYSKLTWAIPAMKTTAKDVACMFIEEYVVLYGIPDRLMTSNVPQFAGKVFESVCAGLNTEILTTTAHHLQTNRRIELYSKTILSRLHRYISEH